MPFLLMGTGPLSCAKAWGGGGVRGGMDLGLAGFELLRPLPQCFENALRVWASSVLSQAPAPDAGCHPRLGGCDVSGGR